MSADDDRGTAYRLGLVCPNKVFQGGRLVAVFFNRWDAAQFAAAASAKAEWAKTRAAVADALRDEERWRL